jgi:acyl-CoA thioester hydrolase
VSTIVSSHVLPVRVYYEDTDAGGIVYHANYMKFAERARTELLRIAGYNHRQILTEYNIIFVVRHAEIDYRAPARLDDSLKVHTETTACGNSSFTLKQTVSHEDKVLAELKSVIVAINPEGRPVRLPPQLRQIFCSHMETK